MINKELKDLGLRVYNNEMKYEVKESGEKFCQDEADIVALVDRTFNSGAVTVEKLSVFNEVVVRTAEVIAEPKKEQILNLFASYENLADGTIKMVKVPKTTEKARLVWTANGAGVDYIRLSQDETQKPAVPAILSTGAYYELSDFSSNQVEAFRNVVDTVVEAELDLYFATVKEMIASAVTSGDIPAKNCAIGSDLDVADYKKVENVMIRLGGGRPVFVADSALIDSIGATQATVAPSLLTDDLRKALREDLVLTQLSKSVAVSLINPYIDKENSKVAFDVQEGYIFPSSGAAKAICINKFGATKQFTELDIETERVFIKIKEKVSFDLVDCRRIGVVRDTAIAL